MIQEDTIMQELNKICDFVQDKSGINFVRERNEIKEKRTIDKERTICKIKLYFKDFYGKTDRIIISVRLDITEFDKIYLPVQERYLIHPYSDANECKIAVRCVKLEELLATKLKCLLQRWHVADLYDLIYSIFLNRDIDINRSEIVTTFLKKTIFEPSPGVVKNLLLGLPFEIFKEFWQKHLTCPKISIIDFDTALTNFKRIIEDLFGHFSIDHRVHAFFPQHFRNVILQAGRTITLLKLSYDGYQREVEPYSIIYKRRSDGVAREYFYAYDRTGGRSGVKSIKSFLHHKIESLKNTDQKFEPQLPMELCKMGEHGEKTYFGSPFSKRRENRNISVNRSTRRPRMFHGITYVIQCSYCMKKFRRSSYNTRLNEHKDKYGNRCFGRIGHIV